MGVVVERVDEAVEEVGEVGGEGEDRVVAMTLAATAKGQVFVAAEGTAATVMQRESDRTAGPCS